MSRIMVSFGSNSILTNYECSNLGNRFKGRPCCYPAVARDRCCLLIPTPWTLRQRRSVTHRKRSPREHRRLIPRGLPPVTSESCPETLMVYIDHVIHPRIQSVRDASPKRTEGVRAARKTDSVGDTQTMVAWSCVLPACSDIYTIEGITAGQLYDFQDLNLKLLPGERLYLYTNADIAADYYSAAVSWEEE